MTPLAEHLHSMILEGYERAHGRKPTLKERYEAALEEAAFLHGRVSSGYERRGCVWNADIGTAKPKMEAVTIDGEERCEHPAE